MTCTSKIAITTTDDHTIVSVDDFELFDYLDDFFVARGFECSQVSITNPGDKRAHSLYFSLAYEPAMLSAAISEIPVEEIERILALSARGA